MSLGDAIEIVKIGGPYSTYPGTGDLYGVTDLSIEAKFWDWGLARATAVILNAVIDGKLVLKSAGPNKVRT